MYSTIAPEFTFVCEAMKLCNITLNLNTYVLPGREKLASVPAGGAVAAAAGGAAAAGDAPG